MRLAIIWAVAALILTACEESGRSEIYNENNTNVIDGIVYDINEEPINGLYKIYYPNGNVKMEVLSKDGKPHGEGRFYDENGNLQFKGIFKDGQIDGTVYNYFADGTVRNEMHYVDGVQDGKQYIYDENGDPAAELVFENGKAVSGYAYIGDKQVEFTQEELAAME